ncbi:MAG TPA: hypothetical protein VKV28_15500 [Candidatus Binataceae bacterium]|nr:hypothetical protein [Candidatus Binataceae bacterium]
MATKQEPPMLPAGEGLDLILRQLSRVGKRINSLAAQQLIFSVLAVLLGAGAVVVFAAFFASPTLFLVTAVAVALATLIAFPWVIVKAVGHFASVPATAHLTDERAELRGRLVTLVTLRDQAHHLRLWPYLVEDTLLKVPEFEPARIERRRLSPAFYAFMSACLIALLAAMSAHIARQRQLATQAQIAAAMEIDPSQVRPSNGSHGVQAEIVGSAQQLRDLAQRLQGEARTMPQDHSNSLASRARDLASSLQNRLTGADENPEDRVKMRLAQTLDDSNPEAPPLQQPGYSNPTSDQQLADSNKQPGPLGSGNANQTSGPETNVPNDSNSMSGAPTKMQAPANPNTPMSQVNAPGQNSTQSGDSDQQSRQRTGNGGGGASHGGGTDPDSLMGPPDALVRHGTDNFEIPVDARLQAHSPIHDGQPYNPPKVKVGLSSHQYADQPLVRTTVPANDRETIRRVFER